MLLSSFRLWSYAPKSRKYGFIPRAYAKSPAMTSTDEKADEVVERENVSIGAEDVLESDVSDKDLSNLIHDAISMHKKSDQAQGKQNLRFMPTY